MVNTGSQETYPQQRRGPGGALGPPIRSKMEPFWGMVIHENTCCKANYAYARKVWFMIHLFPFWINQNLFFIALLIPFMFKFMLFFSMKYVQCKIIHFCFWSLARWNSLKTYPWHQNFSPRELNREWAGFTTKLNNRAKVAMFSIWGYK